MPTYRTVTDRTVLLNHAPSARHPRTCQAQGGFTMVELLVTMLLLTISLTGLAALQVGTVKRVTEANRSTQAMRLAQQVLARYEAPSMAYGLLPAALPQPVWEQEFSRDGENTMVNVGVDGDVPTITSPPQDRPFTVERLIEELDGSRRLVSIRVSWVAQQLGLSATGQRQFIRRSVTLSTQRSP